MSIRRFPVSLSAMRTLAVAALLCAAAAGFPSVQFKYRDFFSGVTVGILLVLVIALFRSHSAEVDGDGTTDAKPIPAARLQKRIPGEQPNDRP
jgi:hypothetical protein